MDAQAKQQIVERVKQASNILVTVSTNPSVDQLSACIGLTLLLNKMDKHATAVYSGKTPSTIEFLQPEKTLETNIDSLRDFIISLDKSKADKLRYKVEDQVVRIFITPYRTSLSEKDLVFSQGDFNVEVVVALGIKDKNQIDGAITNHGRILHDATVISLNAGPGNAPNLGQINWQEPAASSLSEMLVSISEAFGTGLIDNQIATAFLTGIVAETERFSNDKTSPKVMTMSAQLMAAGANQKLIVSKLEPPPPPPPPAPVPKKPKPQPPKPVTPIKEPPKEEEKKTDGELNVSHQPAKPDGTEVQISPNEIHIDEQGNLKTLAEIRSDAEKAQERAMTSAAAEPPPEPEVIPPYAEPPQDLPPLPPQPSTPPPIPSKPSEPTLQIPQLPQMPPPPSGGNPNPHALLDPDGHPPVMAAPFTANTQPEWIDTYNSVPIDPLSSSQQNSSGFVGHSPMVNPPPHQPANPTIDSARSAVQNALAGSVPPADSPVAGLNSSPLGPPLHITAEPAQTPSLNVPTPVNGTPSEAQTNGTAPPPVPPPLMFGSQSSQKTSPKN